MTAPTEDTFVEEAPAPKKWTLPELRKFDGQLFIMNNTPQYLTFHEQLGDKRVDFELEPVGEPDAIAFLPKLALDMRGLQKLWMKGSVTISTDPDMEERIMLENAKAVGASEARLAELMGHQTASNTANQMEEKLCKVCGKRDQTTGVITMGRVIQSRRQVLDGVIPLCPQHLDQANFFVPRQVSEGGEQHWEFDSLKMTPTQR